MEEEIEGKSNSVQAKVALGDSQPNNFPLCFSPIAHTTPFGRHQSSSAELFFSPITVENQIAYASEVRPKLVTVKH
jgi:hypothetical protein